MLQYQKPEVKAMPEVAARITTEGQDHILGFTQHLLKKILTEEEYNDFKRWMRHQTIRIDGSTAIYYRMDVMRWAYGLDRWRAEMEG